MIPLRYEYDTEVSSPVVDLEVNGHTLPFVIDTGSTDTVVGLNWIKQADLTEHIIPVSGKFYLGKLPLWVEMGGIYFYIVADVLDMQWNLFGLDLL